MRSVVVLSEAAADLEAGRDFYDFQEMGVGTYFIDSILSDIESLALFHGIHPRHHGLHRMLASRFPFGIYYDETSNQTQVFAILDLRNDPLWIRAELASR